jgi:carboxymethylenebutenolidase
MGETITLTAEDGHELGAYRARPAGPPKGGLVVIQEIFGVNGHIRDVCDRFAEAGYLAVAPAIYDRVERDVQLGYDPDGIARGRDLRSHCDMAEVMKDVAAADAAAGGGKIGIVGYCWGGLIVYVAACRLGGKLACGAGYYGAGIPAYLEEEPAAPLMLHFGAVDAGIPLSEVDEVRKACPQVAIHVYDGAGHGFNCDRRAQHHAEAASLALDRTLEFFSKHLA